MSVKADKWIAQWIIGDPDDPDINPASLDLRLGNHMIRRTPDPDEQMGVIEQEWKDLEDGQQILLEPGSQWLVCTDTVYVREGQAGLFTLKSSLARRGLFMSHPGWIDPGYEGAITFSVTVQVPVVLTVGEKVGQLIYLTMEEIPRKIYGVDIGRYQGSTGVTKEKDSAEEEGNS